jgi:hypothetical protein
MLTKIKTLLKILKADRTIKVVANIVTIDD